MRLDCPRQKTGRAKAVVASRLRLDSDLFPHNAREIVRIEELTDRLYSISHRNHVLTRNSVWCVGADIVMESLRSKSYFAAQNVKSPGVRQLSAAQT